MSNRTIEDWMRFNQAYLIAEINVLKAKLLLKTDFPEGENEPEEKVRALEQASGALELATNELNNQSRLASLVDLFELSPFEKNVLLMGVGVELDSDFANIVAGLHGNESLRMPTLGLALSSLSNAHWSALNPNGPLRYWQLIKIKDSAVLTSSSFCVNETILHYLLGLNVMDSKLGELLTPISSNAELVSSHQATAEEIVQALSRPAGPAKTPVIQLRGKSIDDQKAIISQLFDQYDLSAYYLPVQLLPGNFHDLAELIRSWNREALLHRYVLFLDASQLSSLGQPTISFVEHLLETILGIVVISSEYKFTQVSRGIYTMDVEKPSQQEQQLLWKKQFGPDTAAELDGAIGKLVTQFNFDSHSITYLSQLVSVGQSANGTATSSAAHLQEKLWNSCCRHTRPELAALAQPITPVAVWDDLVLPQSQKDMLREICVHVEERQKVYYEWGFKGKSNRGLGISAVFSGESGTGKTMASEVIANALQLDLFRIDLSQVVNKYIGETEKNLKKIFDAAEDSGAILLFDEADALFGKRNDVKDSHDRYSNIQVSYLLQKMEAYRGLAILTTNLKNSIDKAFLRRIRFVVQFPFPDAQMRGEIWRRVFPQQTPTQDLDINRLAKLNVAGGNIRNIALNASFSAAHKNHPVTMLDIHHAARNEYNKIEKHMSPFESLI